MYYTELDPFTGNALFVEKDARRKQRQKEIVTQKDSHHEGHKVSRRDPY
jgi:hypothetical protein